MKKTSEFYKYFRKYFKRCPFTLIKEFDEEEWKKEARQPENIRNIMNYNFLWCYILLQALIQFKEEILDNKEKVEALLDDENTPYYLSQDIMVETLEQVAEINSLIMKWTNDEKDKYADADGGN